MWSGHDPIENRKSTELYSVAELRGGFAVEKGRHRGIQEERGA